MAETVDRSRSMGLVVALIAGCLVIGVVSFFYLRSTLLGAARTELAPQLADERLDQLVVMLDTFKAEHGSYPATLPELADGTAQPLDPWGRAFLYRRLDEAIEAVEGGEQPVPGRYRLSTLGADGQPGGTGPDEDRVREPD